MPVTDSNPGPSGPQALSAETTCFSFLMPQSCSPDLPAQRPRDTHCNGGRASGSAGCTGVPILLSPSLGVPVPCRGKGRQPREG